MAILDLFRLFGNAKEAAQPIVEAKPRPQNWTCQICQATASYLDTVDFNKSCEESMGVVLPSSGMPIDYFLCRQCGFCFAPGMYAWSFSDFERLIYNDDYGLIDPDYKSVRPDANARWIDNNLGKNKSGIRHFDYGGGSGLLSDMLRGKGWESSSYDPFVNADVRVEDLGSFDLVTAFEVFEHVPDISALFRDLGLLCKPDGLLLFSTLLSDGEIAQGDKLTWWYASPRNGHISLFSAKSLGICMQKSGLMHGSFSPNLHMACRTLPQWARHLIGS